MNINKKEISNYLSENLDIGKSDTSKFVDSFFKHITEIIKTKNLKIKNFGTFKRHQAPERIGRNPKSMEVFKIRKKNTIKFHASQSIKNILNGK